MSCASVAGVDSPAVARQHVRAGSPLPVACDVYAPCGIFFRLPGLRCVVPVASVVPALEDAAAAMASMPPVRCPDYFGFCLSDFLKCLCQHLFSVN